MESLGSLPHLHVRATGLSLPFPFFILCISQLGHKTRPGHCNLQQKIYHILCDIVFRLCVIKLWPATCLFITGGGVVPHIHNLGGGGF